MPSRALPRKRHAEPSYRQGRGIAGMPTFIFRPGSAGRQRMLPAFTISSTPLPSTTGCTTGPPRPPEARSAVSAVFSALSTLTDDEDEEPELRPLAFRAGARRRHGQKHQVVTSSWPCVSACFAF